MKELQKGIVQMPININLVFPNQYWLTNIDGRDLQKLKDSLDKTWGNFQQPILVRQVWAGYEIIDGVQRYNAMKELDFEQIMCSIEELSDREAIVRAIQANKFKGEFDQIKLARLLKDLKDVYDMNNIELSDALWFEAEELYSLQMLLEDADKESIEAMDDVQIDDIPDEIEDVKLPVDNEPIVLDLSQDEMDMITTLTVKSWLPRDKAILASVAMLRDSYRD